MKFVKVSERTLIVGLLVGAFMAVLVVCAAVYYLDAKRIRHRSAFLQLENIYSALSRYNDEHGNLPLSQGPSGSPPVSWRVQIFPYLVPTRNAEIYDHEKPWNDTANLTLQNAGFARFHYSPFASARDLADSPPNLNTYYKAITGTDTAFDPSETRTLESLPDDVILVVRVEESDTHWMEPDDLNVESVSSPAAKELLLGDNGYAVLFADGEAWWLSAAVPFEDLIKFLTIESAKQVDRDVLLAPYRLRWRAQF